MRELGKKRAMPGCLRGFHRSRLKQFGKKPISNWSWPKFKVFLDEQCEHAYLKIEK
jgi:hypothetical protein